MNFFKNTGEIRHIYTLIDRVSQKSGPTFEAANHATAIRSIKSMQDVMMGTEEFMITQLAILKNYGTPEVRMELAYESWDLQAFIDRYEYKPIVTTNKKEVKNA